MSRVQCHNNTGRLRAASAPSGLPPLAPGFRFQPTDGELLGHYLWGKLQGTLSEVENGVVPELDVLQWEPWDLMPMEPHREGPQREKERFVFWRRGLKYAKGQRASRGTPRGFWKSTGADKSLTVSLPADAVPSVQGLPGEEGLGTSDPGGHGTAHSSQGALATATNTLGGFPNQSTKLRRSSRKQDFSKGGPPEASAGGTPDDPQRGSARHAGAPGLSGTTERRPVGAQRTLVLVGARKTLVFYVGKAPKGERTNWIMHEYRLESVGGQCTNPGAAASSGALGEIVLCHIFQKRTQGGIDTAEEEVLALRTRLEAEEPRSPPPTAMKDERRSTDDRPIQDPLDALSPRTPKVMKRERPQEPFTNTRSIPDSLSRGTQRGLHATRIGNGRQGQPRRATLDEEGPEDSPELAAQHFGPNLDSFSGLMEWDKRLGNQDSR